MKSLYTALFFLLCQPSFATCEPLLAGRSLSLRNASNILVGTVTNVGSRDFPIYRFTEAPTTEAIKIAAREIPDFLEHLSFNQHPDWPAFKARLEAGNFSYDHWEGKNAGVGSLTWKNRRLIITRQQRFSSLLQEVHFFASYRYNPVTRSFHELDARVMGEIPTQEIGSSASINHLLDLADATGARVLLVDQLPKRRIYRVGSQMFFLLGRNEAQITDARVDETWIAEIYKQLESNTDSLVSVSKIGNSLRMAQTVEIGKIHFDSVNNPSRNFSVTGLPFFTPGSTGQRWFSRLQSLLPAPWRIRVLWMQSAQPQNPVAGLELNESAQAIDLYINADPRFLSAIERFRIEKNISAFTEELALETHRVGPLAPGASRAKQAWNESFDFNTRIRRVRRFDTDPTELTIDGHRTLGTEDGGVLRLASKGNNPFLNELWDLAQKYRIAIQLLVGENNIDSDPRVVKFLYQEGKPVIQVHLKEDKISGTEALDGFFPVHSTEPHIRYQVMLDPNSMSSFFANLAFKHFRVSDAALEAELASPQKTEAVLDVIRSDYGDKVQHLIPFSGPQFVRKISKGNLLMAQGIIPIHDLQEWGVDSASLGELASARPHELQVWIATPASQGSFEPQADIAEFYSDRMQNVGVLVLSPGARGSIPDALAKAKTYLERIRNKGAAVRNEVLNQTDQIPPR